MSKRPLATMPARPPKFVLDFDVPLSWLFTQQSTGYTNGVLWKMRSEPPIVPCIWPFELVEVLREAEQGGAVLPPATDQYLTRLMSFPFWVDSAPAVRAFSSILAIARAHSLPMGDAAVLELAVRRKLPLATNETQLQQAAAGLRIPIYQP